MNCKVLRRNMDAVKDSSSVFTRDWVGLNLEIIWDEIGTGGSGNLDLVETWNEEGTGAGAGDDQGIN